MSDLGSIIEAIEMEIIETIAENSIFGTDEVKRCYDIFKSFDLIIKGWEYAEKTGYHNLECACILAKAKDEQ
jgi:hypothetical protein